MTRTRFVLFLGICAIGLSGQMAVAGQLDLAILPPDLPPANVCNAPPEEREEGELQEDLGQDADAAEGLDAPELQDRLRLIRSEIRRYMQIDADAHFSFIQALISRRAELDPEFAGPDEYLTRIELYIAARRLEALSESALLETLRAQAAELTNNQRLSLARYLLAGLAGEEAREEAFAHITEAAFSGNANALMDVLRLQLAGTKLPGWELSIQDTAYMAFGGMIGQFNRGLCNRAERMARAYVDGTILKPNPDLAYAWRKLAADMGGAEAAWRVVEYQLAATGENQNDEELLYYLRQAVQTGYSVTGEDVADIQRSGASTEAEIRTILRRNHARSGAAHRRSAVSHMSLDVNQITDSIVPDSPLLRHLHEIAQLPDVPASVWTRLARETLLRKGRWAGEAEALRYLARAVQDGDEDAMLMMSGMLLRHRDDADAIALSETLLHDAVATFGSAPAMRALEDFYRCQHPGAPVVTDARYWSHARRISDAEPLNISDTDLARLDPMREPENVARLQAHALRGHGTSRGRFLQYLQSNLLVAQPTLVFWAEAVAESDRALEDYVASEYELALTPAERASAIELLRRVYLDIRAPIALELAVALVEHGGRDPEIVAEVRKLLEYGARRAEGASLRLLQRLTKQDSAEFYAQYADVIEARGDFLSMMVAAPHVDDEKFDDYMARARSMMNCSTKDVSELADAYLQREREADAVHWLRIGLAMEHGHVLSRLGLSTDQMDAFDTGAAPVLSDAAAPAASPDNTDALRRAYITTSDATSPVFDPERAADTLRRLLDTDKRDWALAQYRDAHWQIRDKVTAETDIPSFLKMAAASGNSRAQLEYARHLQDMAQDKSALEEAADWLEKAAVAGNADAMMELAQAIAFGLGRPQDRRLAVIWLEKAQELGNERARSLISVLTAAGLE